MATDTDTAQSTGVIPPDTFGTRLLLARLHVGLTVRDAAERCSLNYGSWSNWENGARPRDLLDTVEKISAGLGMDYDWLLFGGPLAPEGRPLRRRSRVNTLRYAPPTVRRRASVRPPSRKTDGRGPSTRRPNIIPRPLTATG